jgi:hypothetical protein
LAFGPERNGVMKTDAKRLTTLARKFVAKKMEELGYLPNIWTKKDKGRTIVQVELPDDMSEFYQDLKRNIAKSNDKYGPKLD